MQWIRQSIMHAFTIGFACIQCIRFMRYTFANLRIHGCMHPAQRCAFGELTSSVCSVVTAVFCAHSPPTRCWCCHQAESSTRSGHNPARHRIDDADMVSLAHLCQLRRLAALRPVGAGASNCAARLSGTSPACICCLHDSPSTGGALHASPGGSHHPQAVPNQCVWLDPRRELG